MRRLLVLWRLQVQAYLWWHVGAAFVAVVCLSCGLSCAFGLEEPRAVFTQLTFFTALRSLLREAWCFSLLLLCLVHVIGAPVAALTLCLRAYTIGFAWGWWLGSLGFPGFLTFLVLLLPQGVLVLLSLVGACCVGLAHAFRCRPLDRRGYVLAIAAWSLPAFCALPLEWLALAVML